MPGPAPTCNCGRCRKCKVRKNVKTYQQRKIRASLGIIKPIDQTPIPSPLPECNCGECLRCKITKRLLENKDIGYFEKQDLVFQKYFFDHDYDCSHCGDWKIFCKCGGIIIKSTQESKDKSND